MAVVIGTHKLFSDVMSAYAVIESGLWLLAQFDGLLLPKEVAERIVRWVQCTTALDVGAIVSVGAGMATLRRIDGVRVDRDTAAGVLRIVEKAAAARCHMTVTFLGHDPQPYSASREAAEAFAESADYVHVEIHGPARAADPAFPYERLWLK